MLFRSSEETQADLATRDARNKRFAAMTAQGEIDVANDPQAIMVRLDRSLKDHENRAGEFRTVADLRRLLESGRLPLVHFEEIVREIGGGTLPSYNRKRVLAVLRAPG